MTEREARGDGRMSDLEALMWNLEKDPQLSSIFANITLVDRPPDIAVLKARLRRAIKTVPRLGDRVVPAIGRLAPPAWEPDPSLDIDYHIHHVALPPPGNRRALYDFGTTMVGRPFDRARPLWEFAVVENLADGGAAIIQKLHHTISDGVGAVRLSEQFIDIERTPADLDALDDQLQTEPGPDHSSEPLADIWSRTVDAAAHGLRRWGGRAVRVADDARGLVADPGRLGELATEVVETARSVGRQASMSDRARSPLWETRSRLRSFETLQAPLDETLAASRAAGVKLNDIFVTAAARGVGAYHRAHDAPVDELRMAMPISTRDDASAGGNAFAPARVLVPVAIDDPATHLAEVHQRLTQVRSERAFGVLEALSGAANLLPTSVAVNLARRQAETVDFTTSNVRGAPIPLYIAGARILANYPIGPLASTAFNLTLLSSEDRLDMGLHIDAGAVTDPEGLRRHVETAFAELLA